MLKCVLVSMAMLFCLGAAFAQDDSFMSAGYFDARNLAFEITGSPFSRDQTSSDGAILSFGSLRARYAASNTVVPRIGGIMRMSNDQVAPDVVENNSMYTIMAGFEYHFRIEGGFRSYMAFDGLFGQQFSSVESTTGPTISGANYNPIGTSSDYPNSDRGYMMYGAALGVGSEYHTSSNFYFGTEIGLQFARYEYDNIEVDGQLFVESTIKNLANVNTINTIRVGFKFR